MKPYKYISRKGSFRVIENSKGERWLCRRKKKKHNDRRQKKPRLVFFYPIKRIL